MTVLGGADPQGSLDALAAELSQEREARVSASARPVESPEALMTRIRWDVRRLTVETEARDFRGRRVPVTAPALLTELRAAIRPDQGGSGSGRASSPSTRAAIAVDALDLYETLVDQIGSIFESATDRTARGTPEQLLMEWLVEWELAFRRGELSDVQLGVYADRIARWVRQIDGHFNPPKEREMPLCPVCGFTHVLVDAQGYVEQQRALKVRIWERTGRARAECRACGAVWLGEVHPAGATAGIRELLDAVEANYELYGPLNGEVIVAPTERTTHGH